MPHAVDFGRSGCRKADSLQKGRQPARKGRQPQESAGSLKVAVIECPGRVLPVFHVAEQVRLICRKADSLQKGRQPARKGRQPQESAGSLKVAFIECPGRVLPVFHVAEQVRLIDLDGEDGWGRVAVILETMAPISACGDWRTWASAGCCMALLRGSWRHSMLAICSQLPRRTWRGIGVDTPVLRIRVSARSTAPHC